MTGVQTCALPICRIGCGWGDAAGRDVHRHGVVPAVGGERRVDPGVRGPGRARHRRSARAVREFNASEHSDFHPHCTLADADGEEDVARWMDTPLPSTPILVEGLSVHLGDSVVTFPFAPALSLEEKADAWSLSEDEMSSAQLAYVSKAAGGDAAVIAAVKKALKNKASIKELVKVLRELYGDSMLAASHDAAHAAGGTIAASLGDVSKDVPKDYWSNWKPGFGEAADKAADGGMRAMLDKAELTIKGLSDTTVDRIGNKVAEGLAKGDSMEATGKAIREVLA